MKKLGKLLLTFVLVFAFAFALVGCGNGDKLTGTTTIVLNNGSSNVEYLIDLEEGEFVEGDNVYKALVWLAENEDITFSATTTFATTGNDAFVNSIGSLNPAYGSTEYVALFHNVESQKDVSAWALPDKTYNGTTVYYSGVGVGALKLADGLIVYLSLLSY